MAAPKRELTSTELRDLLTELGGRLQAKVRAVHGGAAGP